MARKRRNTTETLTTIECEPTLPVVSTIVEKDPSFVSLREKLSQVNQHDGVKGYIIRDVASAAIDLKEPSNLLALALLSSYVVDAGQEFSATFDLGRVESIVLEGKASKVLCVTIGKNIVNVFMEKAINHNQILSEIHANLGE